MADSMNFGPEWLRNLSSEGSSSGPKYQLAEFRYGREEMLALFDRNAKPPENMARLHDLFVEKTQSPVSLLPMTEEENKLWNRGINSELVIRPGGKAPPPGLQGASLRGRGGSVDRGRGRGRGGSFFYPRPGYDDSDLQGKDPAGTFLRSSRSFDRSQMGERGWPERNGGDPADWNGSTSPRKEYSGLGGLGGGMTRGGHGGTDNNWRRNRGGGVVGGEEDDGWRREKWPRSSWREEGAEPPEGAKPLQGGPGVQGNRSSNWGRGWVDEGVRGGGREQHEYEGRRHDEMPEWAHADHHEPSGSFDASGAFHGSCSDEEEGQGDNGGNHRPTEPAPEPSPPAPKPHNPPQQQQQQPEKSASSVALSDAQSLDRIRAQHQNFVTKAEPKEPPPDARKEPTPASASEKPDPPTARVLPLPTNAAPAQPTTPSVGGRERNEATRQGSEDDISRFTVDSVVRLIEDEERPPVRPPSDRDIWYYRDPNGTEQGPFQSNEMYSWYNSGYFQDSLLVRRDHEERYRALGQLIRSTGRIPFFPVPPPPPAPAAEGFPFSLLGQMQRNVMKLPDAEHWSAMTQAERDAVMRQKLAMSQTPMLDPMTRLLTQLQQVKTGMSPQAPHNPLAVDPVRALMMMGPQPPPAHHLPHPALQHPQTHPLQAALNSVLPGVAQTDLQADALQRVMLRKNEATKAQPRPAVDSLWSGPGRPSWSNGLAGIPAGVPAGVQNAVPRWEMKTEDEILAEQQKQLHQKRLATDELRKKEEEQQRRVREEEERERREEERRRKEEDSLRVLLRLPQRGFGHCMNACQPLLAGSQPSPRPLKKLQREREKEEEEGRKRLEEQRRKLEEMKRMEDAQKKKEEKEKKKEEDRERKRMVEEEKKQQEEEKKRVEKEAEEGRRQEELALQQQEQQRRQEEALRCLREQQMKTRVKPWSQSTLPPSSLADIQAQEKERKLQQQREQLLLTQLLANEQIREAQEEKMNKPAAGLNLKWASTPAPRADHVKSLAEIQAEEQIQLAKQLEKERLERQQQQRDLPINSGIWGGSAGLTWTNHGSGGPWGGVASSAAPSAGFWDDVTPPPAKAKAKTPLSPAKTKPQNTNGTKKTTVVNNAKAAKPKAKREEAAVMKLFEPQGDEFTSWCSDTLYALQAGIDVPTFSAFLREIESPYEVKDYVKTYLGETREAAEFARNFLEKRSRWRASRRSNQDEDDMCAPAVAINPAAANPEAQDAARKGKKAKKGKMIKVDTRILGFNVTAAPNRINVGERETYDPSS